MTDVLAAEAAEIAELEKQASLNPAKGDAPEPPAEDPEQELTDDPAPEPTPQAKLNPGQIVRRRDFLDQKERREAAERKAQDLEARYAQDMSKVNERLAVLAQSYAPKAEAPPAPEIPDVNADPIGHFQAKDAQRERELNELREWKKSTAQTSEHADKLQRIGHEVNRLEAEFTRATPDYPAAQQHLFKTWEAEAAVAGVSVAEAIRSRSWEIVQIAGRTGQNPADLAYKLAMARGYAKANGAGPRANPTIDTLARGVAASKSTSAAPGQAAPGVPTIDALLKMDDDEFASKFAARGSKEWDRTMRKLMGAA